MLIKNIENKPSGKNRSSTNTREYCLFSLKNLGSKVFSIDCQLLLQLKKFNPRVIHLNSFLWYWLNAGQIKNSLQMCISPVETSIISENNSKIDYFGFIELRKCKSDDEMALAVS